MTESISHPSPVDATYVEPSAEEPLEPGLKEVVPELVELEVAVPHLKPASR
jgi:hypothetical protein